MTTTEDLSLEQRVALLPLEDQEALLSEFDISTLPWDWGWNGRPSQLLSMGPPENGAEEWSLAVAMAGRGWGKACTLDTMIPHTLPLSTSTGFTKMGDICIGDTVYDEQGKPCKVTAIFDRTPEIAYRVTFSDGTFIDACDEHQWVTWTHRDRKQYLRNNPGATAFPRDWVSHREPLYRASNKGGKVPTGQSVGPEIRTTQQILDTLTQKTTRGDLNHCIPTTQPLQTPDVSLLLDPWVLGYWLGNGASAGGGVSGHREDEEGVRENLLRAGYATGVPHAVSVTSPNAFGYTVIRLRTTLRALDLLDNKHVPAAYLWASEPQRRALLAGLLDSDGYCDPSNGQVEFGSTTRVLADAVVHLARSLGEKPVLGTGRAKLNGVDHGEKYRVTWRPTVNPFRLTRKAAAFRPLGAQALRNRHRMIASVEPIPPVPMRCITVDSPNSMYLAGEGMIPTHNTLCGAQWIRALDQSWKSLGRDPGQHMRFFLLGRTAADVRDVMLEGPSGLMNVWPPSLRDKVTWIPSRRRVELPNGSVGLCFSGEEPDQLRGPASHVSWVDELAAFRQVRAIDGEATAWENLRIGTRLGAHPQILATTTPKRVPVVRELMKEAQEKPGRVLLRRGRTIDNSYLSQAYVEVLMSLYAGTALGAQELEGQILDAVVGAMTTETIIDRNRHKRLPDKIPWIPLIGLDPSVAEKPHDECGIIVMYISKTWPILHRHGWVVDDLSFRGSPEEWSKATVKAAFEHGATVIAEVNQGGAMVKQVLRMAADDLGLPMPQVNPTWSSKSKEARGEPVSAAYAQNRIHHVNVLADLESQVTSWVPGESGYSPDRQDGLVQAATAGLFPEALISGLAGTAAIQSVARQHIAMPKQVQLPRGQYRNRRSA